MKQHFLRIGCFLILCLYSQFSLAVVVSDLFEATVPVVDLSSQAKQQAISKSMEAVLIKVSGNKDVATVPVIIKQMRQTQRFVVAYDYQREGDTLNLHVVFSSDRIKQLLKMAGQTLWQANRPALLVWLSVQEGDSAPQFITADAVHPLVKTWQAAAAKRGLPTFFPIADMMTLQHIGVEDIRAFNTKAADRAAKRYDLEAYTMINITKVPQGVEATFMLQFQGLNYRWTLSAPDETALVDEVNDVLLNSFASRFAMLTGQSNQHHIQFYVENVEDMQAYQHLLTYLEKLTLLEDVQAIKITPREIAFQASLVGKQAQWLRVLREDGVVSQIETRTNNPLKFRLTK